MSQVCTGLRKNVNMGMEHFYSSHERPRPRPAAPNAADRAISIIDQAPPSLLASILARSPAPAPTPTHFASRLMMKERQKMRRNKGSRPHCSDAAGNKCVLHMTGCQVSWEKCQKYCSTMCCRGSPYNILCITVNERTPCRSLLARKQLQYGGPRRVMRPGRGTHTSARLGIRFGAGAGGAQSEMMRFTWHHCSTCEGRAKQVSSGIGNIVGYFHSQFMPIC